MASKKQLANQRRFAKAAKARAKMAVEAADLLFPTGRLDPALLWPGKSTPVVTTYLEAFIADGVTKTADWDAVDQDVGTIAWATYRALDSLLFQLKMMPASVSFVDEGSAGYTAEQLRMLELDRQAALAEFTDLEQEATAEDGGYGVITSLR